MVGPVSEIPNIFQKLEQFTPKRGSPAKRTADETSTENNRTRNEQRKTLNLIDWHTAN